MFKLAFGIFPSGIGCFDDPCGEVVIVLICPQNPYAVFVFSEVEGESIVWLCTAEPDKFITPPFNAGMEMILVKVTHEAVNAVGTNNKVGVIELFQIGYFGSEL